jgi:cytochrome c peroxidase
MMAGSLSAVAAVQAYDWKPLPETPPIPADNPQNDAKIELGKTLFFDPRLSVNGTLSCNSCHNVMAGGDDNRPNSVGVGDQRGGRSAPTVWNAAFLSAQFWDGREPTLEAQAKGPVANPIEMGMPNLDEPLKRLKQIPGYADMFKAAFPDEKDPMSVDNFAKAVAAYERTLITPNSPYDKYVKGDKKAMSEQQVKGMNTFAEIGCTTCHSGAAFAGPEMEMGKGFFMKFPTFPSDYDAKYKLSEDTGRHSVTNDDNDKHMWRVPTLRNVALTAPYFHNGSVPTLDEAVRVMAKTQLNKDLSDAQTADLVAFLNALTGEFPQQTMPRLPTTPGFSAIPMDTASSEGNPHP